MELSGVPEELLLERFLCGSKECFRELVYRRERCVWNTVGYLSPTGTVGANTAEQIFQDLISMLEEDRAKTVLFDWLEQRSLDRAVESLVSFKQSGGHDLSESDVLAAEHPVIRSLVEHGVLTCIAVLLPENLRAVFLFRDVMGLSITRTAQVLALNVFETNARHQRTRQFLYEELKDLYHMPEEVVETLSAPAA